MKYRILLTSVIRNNGDNVYKYYRESNQDGEMEIFETSDVSSVDKKVEELLGVYNKNEINIVAAIDYKVDAIIDANETYVNKIDVLLDGGSITYKMSGSNLFENENYKWVMTYDNDVLEIEYPGLNRILSSSEIVKYNSSNSVKAKIKKDNYTSEEFILKS